jgi:2-polyprenyl-3-methyl-5-hydroxy-6-metoxy-1,4-benzoquinol methylase
MEKHMDEQTRTLNDEGRELWNQKAEFWDNLHGEEGNRFHRTLVSPSVERLLALQADERVLDIACGTGVMARRLAHLGGRVTAVDFSAALIERAKMRGQSSGEPIDYDVVDATDEDALVALGEGQFDAVVSTMALMDMPVLKPLYRAVRRLLRADGRFVFATSHPAFNSNNPIFAVELADQNGKLVTTHTLKFAAYLEMLPVKAVGARNEPAPHNYYHRPLHQLLGEAFAAGLVLDGLEEPAYGIEAANPARPLIWDNFWQFPPVMVARLRIVR